MKLAFVCLADADSEIWRVTLASVRALSERHDVTLVVSSATAGARAAARDAGAQHTALVRTPAEAGDFASIEHRRSALVLDALRSAFGDAGPDYVEFPDAGGSGAVTIQARLTHDPFLIRTRVGVRAFGTVEMARVLDGRLPGTQEAALEHALERICLRHADVRVVPGPAVDETYARFYADEQRLAPAVVVAPGLDPAPPPDAGTPERGREQGPLRLLFAGPLTPRRGAAELVDALLAVDRGAEAWRLTIAGEKPAPAEPVGSLRAQLELAGGDDPRIELRDGAAPLDTLSADHDVLVLPDRWAAWSETGQRALCAGLPLLATPVGGLRQLAVPGTSGWLARDTSVAALTAAIEHLIDHPEELAALRGERGPSRLGARLADPARLAEAYAALLDARPAARAAVLVRERPPLVSVVIPYHRLAPYVEEAIASAFAQEHAELEVIVVNDGSAAPEDAVLHELAGRWRLTLLTQDNQGVGAARNLGIAQALGRYVLPLDADNALEPGFAARGVRTLECEPGLAYVTSWTTYVDEGGEPFEHGDRGYRPLGAYGPELDRQNTAGDAVALIRRHVFQRGHRYPTDVPSFEDWLFYRELRDAGLRGAVMPTPLVRYRVRATSKMRTIGLRHGEQLDAQMRAHLRERSIAWT